MNKQALAQHLLAEIHAQLDQCLDDDTPTFTPKICSFISTEAGREKVIQWIINYVVKEQMSITEAINEIERDFNDNLMES
jgi:hypothetical protein